MYNDQETAFKIDRSCTSLKEIQANERIEWDVCLALAECLDAELVPCRRAFLEAKTEDG